MEIIGENMHIMNTRFLEALDTKDEQTICTMAHRQQVAGATALDLNLGQSKKLAALTTWLIQTVHKVVDLPIFVSSHILKQPEILDTYQGRLVINAVTANDDELARAMHTARTSDSGLVVLLVSSELTPGDINGRLQLASRVLDTAGETGMPLENIYLDPVIACRPDPATWALAAGLPDMDITCGAIRLLKEMSEQWNTIVALSNASACLPAGERSALHCQLLPLLAEAGLDAVILNCLDRQLMAVSHGLQTKNRQRQCVTA